MKEQARKDKQQALLRGQAPTKRRLGGKPSTRRKIKGGRSSRRRWASTHQAWDHTKAQKPTVVIDRSRSARRSHHQMTVRNLPRPRCEAPYKRRAVA